MNEKEFVVKLEAALELAPYADEAKEAIIEMMSGNELSGLRRGLHIAEQVLSEVHKLVEQRKKELGNELVE